MTTRFWETVTCAACGKQSDHIFLGSTNEFGYRDLDGRPAEMRRSTIDVWLQECPHCSYVAREISALPPAVRAVLDRPEWSRLADPKRRPELHERFARRAYIDREIGDSAAAGQHMLWSAWVLDDERDVAGAKAARERAAEFLRQALAQPMQPEGDTERRLVLIDVLRRVGNWSAAAAECARLATRPLGETFASIVRHQSRLISTRRDGCGSLADVFGHEGELTASPN